MSEMIDAILSLDYEAQHFGFHPRTFLDLVYNVFYENLSQSLMDMKHYMIQEFAKTVPPFVIIKQTDTFLQEIGKTLDKAIDKLEVYLNANVFVIEPNIILPEDEVHIKNPCTKEKEEKLDAEIEELKQKILVEKAKKFCLKKKISEQKKVKEILFSFQSELRCLLAAANQEGVTPENIESLFTDLLTLLNMSVHLSTEENNEVKRKNSMLFEENKM